jgi:DnaJ-class molecular chaperone
MGLRGADEIATVNIPIKTAKTGGSVRMLLPTGRAYEVNIPPGVSDGAQLRLRGLGQPGQDGGEPGDAIVTIEIEPRDKPSSAPGTAWQGFGVRAIG